MTEDRPRIGISSCLLGHAVRYDASHKRDPILIETIGSQVEWVPVCPEVEAGFGTPRDPMRLVLTMPASGAWHERFPKQHLSLIVVRTGVDVTDRLRDYATSRVERLAEERLSGFILKQDSPSCGMERVKVFTGDGRSDRGGRGLFAEALMARWPTLPVEEEGRLADQRLRDDFIARVFAYRQLHYR